MAERSGEKQVPEGSQPVTRSPQSGDMFGDIVRAEKERRASQAAGQSRQDGFGARIGRILVAPFRWFGIGQRKV